MAKANEQTAQVDSAFPLAERLFVHHWNHKAGFEVEHIARLCLEAAEAFERVKRERAEPRATKAA